MTETPDESEHRHEKEIEERSANMPLQEDAQRQPREDDNESGTFIRGEERNEGVGELSPLPDSAGGDTPPEKDNLTEIEKATGHSLSDDLTAETTRQTDREPGPAPRRDSRS